MESPDLYEYGLVGVNPYDIIHLKLFLSPRIPAAGDQDFVNVKADRGETVKNFKERLAKTLWHPDLVSFHLVWGGSVIPETLLIRDSGLELYLVACLVAPSTSACPHRWFHPSVLQNLQYNYDPREDQSDNMHGDQSFSDLLRVFVEDLSTTSAPWKPTETDINLLNWVQEALRNQNSPEIGMPAVQWYPEYGCALVARLTPYDEIRLSLVFLDNWSFYIHSAPEFRKHNSVPDDNHATVLFVGSVERCNYTQFLVDFQEEFTEVKQRKGTKRSSATGSQGHHKTPGMVQAVMLQVLSNLEDFKVLPKGGFTDVGRHTGGAPRNTAWPLFVRVLHHFLDSKRANDLFHRVLFQLHLRTAEQTIVSLKLIPENPDLAAHHTSERIRELTNSIMQTLRHVAQEAESFARLDSLRAEFILSEARCIRIRHELDVFVMSRAKSISNSYELPCVLPQNVRFEELTVSVPPEPQTSGQVVTKKSVNEIANENTRFTPIPPSVDCTWEEMIRWMTDHAPKCPGSNVLKMIVCNAAESFFFRKMMNLLNIAPSKVEKAMDMYRKVARTLQNCDESKAIRRGELLSKEALVVWIAFCHVHHSAKKSYPLVKEYSVPLQPDDLKFLVLSKKEAVDAAREVIRYLRKNSEGHGPIFSGGIRDETLTFALRFGNGSKAITEVWDREKCAMRKRESMRWAEIQKKKEKLAKLDHELNTLEWKHEEVSRERDTLHQKWMDSYHHHKSVKLKEKEDEQSRLSARISHTKSMISEEETAPSPIFQPCPSHRDLAIMVIFFLTIPDDLSILSRLSFLGKQQLLPNEGEINVLTFPERENHISVDNAIRTQPGPKTVWRAYHDIKSTGRTFTSTARQAGVIIGSSSSTVSGHGWFTSNVRSISSPRDGVWYPDSLEPSLFWNGGGCELDVRSDEMYFNPFLKILPDIPMHKFTENLRRVKGNSTEWPFQWAIFQIGEDTSPERGNYGLAFQNEIRSNLLNKNVWLDFCGIRAYPHQQFRKLCSSLTNRRLPLTSWPVGILLQQAVYQLGSISVDNATERTWHSDASKFDGWTSLREILDDLCEELRSKSRKHHCLATLGELAAHVSQWDSDCRRVARKLATIAEKTSDDLACDEINGSHETIPIIRARRCILYMSCLLCHSAGELSISDVRQICRTLVMAEYTRLFEDPTHLDEKVRTQTATTMNVIAARMPQIYALVVENPQVLTNAVKSVHEAAGKDITWDFRTFQNTEGLRSGVRGESADGLVYHINLQTGTLLIDGRPPSRLPQSILSCPLYMRSFKDRNFEVVRDRNGRFKTARSIGGCFYEFAETGKAPVIREIDSCRTNSPLDLLDSITISSWGKRIPRRLQEMFSHWLCRQTNTVLFRPRCFRAREVHFVLTFSARDSSAMSDESSTPSIATSIAGWSCFKVPSHLRTLDWLILKRDISSLNKLIYLVDEPSAQVLNVLTKFENLAECIHCYKTAGGSYIIDLPRYGLEFELNGEGIFKSNSFSSFSLCRSQNFDDTLMDFSGYLILESEGIKKILVPSGQVRKERGIITIYGSDDVLAKRRFHVYSLHSRFNSIESVGGKLSIEARLQLAALYAATGTLLPEKRIGKTGGEHAIELMRQSWKNAPMSPSETMHLQSVCSFGHLDPTLSLLAFETFSSSQMLNFLPFNSSTTDCISMNIEASTDYILQKTRNQLNPRTLLTDDEESFLHGEVLARTKPRMNPNIEKFPVVSAADTIEYIKRELRGILRSQQDANMVSEFPLDEESFGDTDIDGMIRNDLRESWNAYTQLPAFSLKSENHEGLLIQIQTYLVTCADSRRKLQDAIHFALERVYGPYVGNRCFNIRRAANMEAMSTAGDFLKIHCAIIGTDFLNPFLSSESSGTIRSMISEWMQLCVMEDKLLRMLKEIKRQNTMELIRELKEIERNWDTGQHPSWLAFEVEQQLQIRDLQYRVVDFCLRNPGKITQLNMGEGKTRVILPMLILHLSKRNQLMRIHVLSPLLTEAHDFLHHTITASILNRRFFRIPYHRDVKLTPRQAGKIMSCLVRCRENGGAMVVAPEHRLSLVLKGTELELQNSDSSTRESLQGIYDINYFDLFDESDEILHHRYQLIYAVGSCVPLSAGRERWIAAQAVLRQLQCDQEVAKELQVLAARESYSRGSQCSLDIIRLHSNVPDQQLQMLAQKLVLAVSRDPPYEMRWLNKSIWLKAIISFVTERNRSIDWLCQEVGKHNFTETQLKYLTALRGILAVGLLHHCLTLRYRVDYGIDPRRENRRVAVPYRGSDRPSERAEYAHPDTLILFTHLAYYYRGMSKKECTEAVTTLLELGSIAQKEQYKQWLRGVNSLKDETRRLIDDVDKLDVTNATQMTILHETYQYNMAAISFWLDSCVLPKETMQFPQRISASAFHLTENKTGSITGFSGTKDNSILLPAQVSQELPDIQEVKATDGKMVALILQNQEVHRLLPSAKLFEAVLRVCIRIETSALIDAGALMAGLENYEVAKRMVSLLEENHNNQMQGVVFFDKTEASWVVLSSEGHQWPLGSSPIHERDAFVYFDESHCRGADMKLRDKASALLTIGPGMCKDKLMQAAGRMRKLDRGQKLMFAVPEDIAAQITCDHGSPLTSKELLRWVIGNTVKAIAKGLVMWGSQGGLYCATQDMKTKLTDEVLELDALYGSKVKEIPISESVRQVLASQEKRVANMNVAITSAGRKIMTQIEKRAEEYGSDQFLVHSTVDEECEREIEQERELAREREVMVPKKEPCSQVEWDFDALLTDAHSELNQQRLILDVTSAVKLSAAMGNRFKKLGVEAILWDKSDVYLTPNFIDTVQETYGAPTEDLSHYLRPVDAILFFNGRKCCLLLSEWEFDQVLPRIWGFCKEKGEENLKIGIGNFGLLFPRDGVQSSTKWEMSIPRRGLIHESITNKASAHTLVALQLFAGQTMFPGETRKKALNEMLPTDNAKLAALKMARLRGMQKMIARSDLEEACSLTKG